jgi:N-formylglutamate amidohydrolase
MLTDLVDGALRARGYTVVRNKPYAGGFITEHYGEPALSRHALQIEINRSLYMDERTLARTGGFATVTEDLAAVFATVTQAIDGDLAPRRIAAE